MDKGFIIWKLKDRVESILSNLLEHFFFGRIIGKNNFAPNSEKKKVFNSINYKLESANFKTIIF